MHGKDSFTVWVGLSTDDVYPSLFFYHDLQWKSSKVVHIDTISYRYVVIYTFVEVSKVLWNCVTWLKAV